jgi:DNA-binding NtrC family response regulator
MSDKATILFVDDEERILRTLRMLFKTLYNVQISTDGHEALEILKRETVHVLVSDQRMPKMTGVELLREAKKTSPATMRLLLTGYSDLASIVGSVNEGEIFRYINKPWDNQEIKDIVAQAVNIALITADSAPALVAESAPPAQGSGLGLLVIDEDIKTHDAVKEVTHGRFQTHWATSVDDAFRIMATENIAIVVSEIKVGQEDIMLALKTLKSTYPLILTLVMTSFQDTRALIELINQGQIYRFLPKPVLKGLLERSLEAAAAHYKACVDKPKLLQRHVVETAKETDGAKLSDSIMGYLRKIRGRLS